MLSMAKSIKRIVFTEIQFYRRRRRSLSRSLNKSTKSLNSFPASPRPNHRHRVRDHKPPHRDHRRRCGVLSRRRASCTGQARLAGADEMSGHDSKYFSTTKKGEIPELKEELNSQYKVCALTRFTLFSSCALPRLSIGSCAWIQIRARR
jgi:hypothetical protein